MVPVKMNAYAVNLAVIAGHGDAEKKVFDLTMEFFMAQLSVSLPIYF